LRGFKIGSDPRLFEIGNRPLARIATKGDPGTGELEPFERAPACVRGAVSLERESL